MGGQGLPSAPTEGSLGLSSRDATDIGLIARGGWLAPLPIDPRRDGKPVVGPGQVPLEARGVRQAPFRIEHQADQVPHASMSLVATCVDDQLAAEGRR